MLMTNITFSKGIGTPVYMSPEVLKQEHYKKPSDIYSFSITMYECMKWGEAYEGEIFKFSWKIAEFVMKGKNITKTIRYERRHLFINNTMLETRTKRKIRNNTNHIKITRNTLLIQFFLICHII